MTNDALKIGCFQMCDLPSPIDTSIHLDTVGSLNPSQILLGRPKAKPIICQKHQIEIIEK